jgi:BMFP domain-containing protein YqiC
VFDAKKLDDLARRLAETVPNGAREIGQDLERNLKAVLSSNLARLDLVSREEFDVQKALLERSRLRLEVLEQRVRALETLLVVGDDTASD